jgi:hypothetical protein
LVSESQGNESDLQYVRSALIQVIQDRKIEYATLVGRDSKVIIGANANRTGEVWDPSGIVSKAVELNTRVAVSASISRSEFLKEGPPRWM